MADPVTAYIGLGSNLGDRADNLNRALALLAQSPGVDNVTPSSFYETAPVGVTDQPEFLNACAAVSTNLDPVDLMKTLLAVERDLGRVREKRWGPRVIDLDLLLYADRIVDTEIAKVPHPGMTQRAFVLVPLCEIAPDAVHPVAGKTVRQLLDALGPVGGVRRVES